MDWVSGWSWRCYWKAEAEVGAGERGGTGGGARTGTKAEARDYTEADRPAENGARGIARSWADVYIGT